MKKLVKTDADVIRVARQMDKLILRLQDLAGEITDGDHPNTQEIRDRLWDNQIPVLAWATHVVHTELEHPERYETGWWGIRHKAAAKAVSSRTNEATP